MIPLSVSSSTFAPAGSSRDWNWREVLTGVALLLLLTNVAFYVLTLVRLLLAGP